ncbi:type VII secretion target [Saccharopolyspora sp. NPDC002376]
MTFQVVAEDLTAHASHLEGLTDRVDTAISAAQEAMSDEAYGVLCSFLPPIINPMEEEGMEALKAAKEGITTTADNVRQTAKDYQETDEAGADNFSKFDDAVKVKESAVALREPVESSGSGSSSGGHAPSGSTSASYEAKNIGHMPSQSAEQGFSPAMLGRSSSGPMMDSEPQQYAAKNAPEPQQYAAKNAPEPMQRGEPMSTPQHAPMEPMQLGVTMSSPAHAPLEPAQQGEPMTTPAHQATESTQRPTGTYQGDIYST